MDILKMNKFKFFTVILFVFIFFIYFNFSITASTNPYIEITNVEANLDNQSIKFTVSNNFSENITEYGIILSRIDEELILENDNTYIYKITNKINKQFAVSIKIPKYAFYQNIYATVYVKTTNEIFYSNKVYTSYADVANLDKVIIKDINFNNNSLNFTMASSLENNAEYGLLFSKDDKITELTIENAKNAQFETEIIKLDALNQNNEYFITIKNIPLTELNTTFKVCAYVKNNKTLETYYTKTYEINILDLYFNEIINNINITYNKELDGIKFKTTSNLINNNDYQIGLIFINKETTTLTIHTADAFIIDANGNEISVTMQNIQNGNEKIYVAAYIKTKDYLNNDIYYYSNIYTTSYNEVKDTYLINN